MGIAKMKSGAHGRGGVGIDGFLYGTGLADLPDLLHLGGFCISEICQMCASQICIGWRKIPEWGQHYLILAFANCHHPRLSWSVYFCEIS